MRTGPAASWPAGSKPAREYWYRFTDDHGFGSRVGRTLTAPAPTTRARSRFAFVSCQNVNAGRPERLSPDDLRGRAGGAGGPPRLRAPSGRLRLRAGLVPRGPAAGDVRPAAARHRALSARPEGRATSTSRPTSRTTALLYQGYLHDPDLQDARPGGRSSACGTTTSSAGKGWQSLQNFGGKTSPGADAQGRGQSGVVRVPAGAGGTSRAPRSAEFERARRDRHADRAVRRPRARAGAEQPRRDRTASRRIARCDSGRHLDLIVTDQHSYRSEDPMSAAGGGGSRATRTSSTWCPRRRWRSSMPGGRRTAARPAETIRFGERELPNFRRDAPPQIDPGRAAEGLVSRPAPPLGGHVEGLGQQPGHARLAHRPAESARGP